MLMPGKFFFRLVTWRKSKICRHICVNYIHENSTFVLWFCIQKIFKLNVCSWKWKQKIEKRVTKKIFAKKVEKKSYENSKNERKHVRNVDNLMLKAKRLFRICTVLARLNFCSVFNYFTASKLKIKWKF